MTLFVLTIWISAGLALFLLLFLPMHNNHSDGNKNEVLWQFFSLANELYMWEITFDCNVAYKTVSNDAAVESPFS